jgi:gliding motility-associated protein GldM
MGEKDKDVTTRMLVNDGEGAILKQKIVEYHDKFLELVDQEDQADFSSQIALKVDDETWTKSRKRIKSWEEFNFKQMPLQAAIPILTKFKNDAKSSEAAILNYLINKVGGEEIEFKNFKVVSTPKKSYIIRGDTYTTDISVAATASNLEGIRISVNGSSLNVTDGVATYSATGSSTGVKKYTARIDITNPVTGEVTTEQSEFEYEVGLRSATISLDKMNVFYVGVPNPITVSAAGVSSNDLRVTGSDGLTLTSTGKSQFDVTASRPGLDAIITLSGGGLTPTNFSYKVKPIPPPLPRLGSLLENSVGTGTFKVHAGVGMNAILENFDFDIRCDIVGFTLVHVPKRVDPSVNINRGGKLNANSMGLVNKAKPGDRYFFENIRCKCPGWQVARKIGDITVSIK